MAKERPPLEEMTLRQLRKVASEYGISRYSRMRKCQLLASIQEIEHTKLSVSPSHNLEAQEAVEAAKFELGQQDRMSGELSGVDEGLAELPVGYGESTIVLMPRDPQWAYTYWDIPWERKQEVRRSGGQQLALRLYDVTNINLAYQSPHSIQEYSCDEVARDWYLPIPVSDRDYVVDIGYRCADGRWLVLCRSAQVRVPPIYPSEWIDDQFITVGWTEDLGSQNVAQLTAPGQKEATGPIYEEVFGMSQEAETARVAGSVFGSMQQVPGSVTGSGQMVTGSGQMVTGSGQMVTGSGQMMVGFGQMVTGSGQMVTGSGQMVTGSGQMVTGSGQMMAGFGQMIPGSMHMVAGSMHMVTGSGQMIPGSMHMMGEQSLSSYVFASGIGMWGVPTMSGLNMSGVGFSASAPPVRPRQFWLIADAELIIYGATEPDANVTIGGRPIKLNPDGTFRFQMSFQDGIIDYPIMAVAADGEQTRSIHMKFTRETPSRRTNTKEEAVVEWFS